MSSHTIPGKQEWGIHLLLIILLLVVSTSATFTGITGLSLDDVSGVWKGIPKVTIGTSFLDQKDCQICVDDTYWNTEIADSICQYFGFEGSMIVQEDITPTQPDFFLDGYAVCNKVEDSNLPLECEFRDTCQSVPTISCLLPGYVGCYTHTDASPFFSDGVQGDLGQGSADVQTCAWACPGSPYLGLTNGQQCICGSILGDSSDQGVCDLPCDGDNLQSCGGQNAIIVYSADVIGECGNSEPVDLIPNQPLYIASPGFPASYGGGSEVCTWTIGIDVPVFHNLDIMVLYDLLANGIDRLSISSDSLNLNYGAQGKGNVVHHPYGRLQDTITVTLISSILVPPDKGFLIKFSLTPVNMNSGPTSGPTNAPEEYSTSKTEPSAKITERANNMSSGPTSGPTNAPDEYTTSKTEPPAKMSKLAHLSLDDVSGVWKGIPKVTIETGFHEEKNCQICVDDTYWNTEIADSICQYFGFEGTMIVQEDTPPTEPDFFLDGYAVCNKVEDSNLPLECEFRDTCQRVPTISCLLPGYVGCYTHTDASPFFSDGVQADLGEGSADVQTCAWACPDSPYLGLTNGQQCICGSILGDSSDQGVCDLPCNGDDLQSCGGQNAIIVYSADVIGECGNSEPVDLIPNQPLYIASPGFPASYGGGSEVCTWTIGIDVPVFHNLDIMVLYDLLANGNDRLSISSDTLNFNYGAQGKGNVIHHPYGRLQDTITVSLTSSILVPPDKGFLIKFSLTSVSMNSGPTSGPTNAPEEYTTSKAEPSAKITEQAVSMNSGPTSGPTNAPEEYTTSKTEPSAKITELANSMNSGPTSGPTNAPEEYTTSKTEPAKITERAVSMNSGPTSGPTNAPEENTTFKTEPSAETTELAVSMNSGPTSGPTNAPEENTTSKTEPSAKITELAVSMNSGPTSGPTNAPEENTTSKSEPPAKLSKLGICAAVGLILLVLL